MTALHQRPTVRRRRWRPVDRCVLGQNTTPGCLALGRCCIEDAFAKPSKIVGAVWMRLEGHFDEGIGAAQSP
jgi:hypothetical protein